MTHYSKQLPWLVGSCLAGAIVVSSGEGTALATSAVELGTATLDSAAFHVDLQPVGEYRAGKPAVAEVVLVAKGDYKVNDKYPYRFKFSQGERVRPADSVVTKDAVRFSHRKAVMTLPFTPTASGKSTLAGEFRFSVCTNDRCLVERADLALTVVVR